MMWPIIGMVVLVGLIVLALLDWPWKRMASPMADRARRSIETTNQSGGFNNTGDEDH